MKCFLFMFIYFFAIQRAMPVELIKNPELTNYLQMQAEAIHDAFTERNHLLYRRSKSSSVEINDIGYIIYPGNYSTAKIFPFIKSTCVVMDNEVYFIESNDGTFTIKFFNKFNKRGIMFTRAVQYKRMNILLTRRKSETNIYIVGNNSIDSIQSISTPYARDAKFFVNNENLYLIIINNKGDNLAETSIYKWLGTHFDEIDTIFTTGAVKTYSFSTTTSEIIIILQNLPNEKNVSSVYEFNFEKIKKIQHLTTAEPVHVDSYIFGNKIHIIVFGKSKNNTIYAWSGSRLVKISQFETDSVTEKSEVLQTNESSVVIASLKDRVQVFRPSLEGLRLVGEKRYQSSYSVILDIYKRENTEGSITFIVGLSEDNIININVMSFKIHFVEMETHQNKNMLRECFDNLELKVYNRRKMLKEANNTFSQEKDASAENYSKSILGNTKQGPDEKLSEIRARLDNLQSSLNNYQDTDDNDIIINGSVTIQGSIEAEKLSARDVYIKKLNNKSWTPEQWLMYREAQTVTGPVTIANIVATNLETANDDFFKDLLLKNGDQQISGSVTIGNLTTNEVFAQRVNGVPLEDIYLIEEPQLITGIKTFKDLKTKEANIKLLNGLPPDNLLSVFTGPESSNAVFDTNVEVENLIVEYINDVHWDTFKESVFRIGETTEINGNLTFPEIKTEKLTLKTLNGVEVKDLLTASTDQTIDSDIVFNQIFAENITVNTVNNVKLAKSAVHFDGNATIQGPVKFDRLNVSKDLELIGKLDKDFFLYNGDHIIGTNESDLLQTYNGKIRIHGNLYLKNITLEANAKLIISDEQVDPDLKSLYWTKTTEQEIPVHFEAQSGLTAPHLLTDKLNDIKISQYMLNNNEDKFETSFHFENISIAGDVILNSAANHQPDLNKINKEAVKTNGSFFINGKKTYTDTLRAENLATIVLDGINVFDTLTTHFAGNITGKKIFENVIIQGNLTSDVQSLEFVNDVDIKQLVDGAIYIDQPQDIRKLHFKNITVLDLYVTNFNNRPLNEYISDLEKLFITEEITNLIINGDVSIATVQNVSAINDIDFECLLNNTLKVDASGSILGDIQFFGHAKIGNLVTSYINDMYLPKLISRFLVRDDDQTITAPYSFTNVKANNIIAPKINLVSIKNLVDVSSDLPQTIYALNGIEFFSADLLKSLRANATSPCDLDIALKRINDPPSKEWHSIEIQNEVTFLDTESTLLRVFEQAVAKNSKNIIHAPVKFSNHILAENVISKHINDVNIQEVMDDAVLMDSEVEQVITGHKIFPTLNVLGANVWKNTDSPVVNGVDIPRLVEVMVNKNDAQGVTIRGTKTFFGGLECDKFYSKKVSNVDPENLVNLQNPKLIPSAVFEYLDVENDLNISYVNHINFNRVLQNRLLAKGPDVQTVTGIYFFDDIEIENMKTPSINDIKLDNVIFDTEQQNITGPKYFTQNVEIFGNAKIDYINGVDITREYENSVILGRNANIDGTITFLRPSIANGSINADYINGYAIDDVKGILRKGTTKVEAQKIHGMKKRIINMVKRNLQHVQVMATDYMYIEKSDTLQISVANTISSNIITSKGYVLIHVTGEESGAYCGLPDTCKCPTQYSMEISPEHSVTTFPNKGPQRIFSYDDNGMIIYVLTNSVSTDSNCRTERSRDFNELSMMTWSTLSTSNTTGRFYQYDKSITGYISGVEFFSLNGKSYAIIGIFYDPIKDTHDLDCIVIKFNEDKSKAEEIQRIPTKGAWSIYLFHAAQGITLIIGNVKTTHMHHEDEQTMIYTFNEIDQQFHLLRIVPSYGASMATGVVLGADSLIVLAHKSAPLQILKYNHNYGNYYFYQTLELEAPVIGMSVFYTGGFGISDAYLCIVTGNDNYFIYSFQFIEGWKLESNGELEGLRNLNPFELNKQLYLFAPSTKISSLLTVVKHGSV